MKPSPTLFTSFALLLVACGETKLPPGQSSRTDVPPVDVPALDGQPVDDVSDVTVADADATVSDTPPGDTSTPDVTPDSPTGDQPDARDVPPVTTGLCAWNAADLSIFATRFALCSFRPPQAALNDYFNPINWEGGPLSVRACGALRCVADVSAPGTCGAWMNSCLKYVVTRVAGGTCPSPAASCEGTPAGTFRDCASGVETRDNCTALGRRCVATGGQAACVATAGSACAAGSPPRCTGNTLETCVLGVYTPSRDCDLTGGVCDATANTCRGAGAECTGDATSCDGTQLRVCRGGRLHAIDCGRLVTTASCQTVNGHSFCGTNAECDPTVAAANGACDGNTLVLCAGGRTFRYACEPRNGFTSCMTGMGCVP